MSPAPRPGVRFTLDGRSVLADAGETLIEVAERHGVQVPRLCHSPGLEPAGNCRACMVEVDGERVLAAACCRRPVEGMVVHSDSPRAMQAQRMVLELLLSDMPAQPLRHDDELRGWARRLGVGTSRFGARQRTAADASHPAITVDLDACIQCTRCVRACRDEQVNGVIGLALRGESSRIVFDLGDALGSSSCVACGECVQACPTGALAPAGGAARVPAQTHVDSLCPWCGVGCQVRYQVTDGQISHAQGRDGPANHGRLCVKGRYGFDYSRHPQRLTVPLIRRADAPKDATTLADPEFARQAWFREASWEEALAVAAGGLARLRDAHGPQALAGFGSAKGSNEEAYLFQKIVRLGFGSNHVDHCTRLCHASSVAALLEGLGSAAVSNPVMDVLKAEVVIVIGANPTVNHPVAATWIKNAVQRGTRLVVIDPRQSDLTRLAHVHLQFRPASDVMLLNAMMQTIIEEGLVDERFVAERTQGFDALAAQVRHVTPELAEPVCGIAAARIREVARLYASSRASMIFWGMGVSQHVHGTDNARCLIALALLTGQIGRPGTGLHPLRGQNNVQGASDAGLIPMMLPDYQRVSDAAVRARFAAAWGVPVERLSAEPGLTVVEVMHAIHRGQVRGLYVMGENPAMSDPDTHQTRQALSELELLVVQDLFLTETAMLADVVLPASSFFEKTGSFTNTDRTVQLARQVLQPPGQARQDLWILLQMAQRLGLDVARYGEGEQAVASLFDEMRRSMPNLAGITWQKLQNEGSAVYPCRAEGEAPEVVEFSDHFATPDGRALFVPARSQPADELPDAEYPLVLITGRQLEHWHTGSMSRRSAVLDALEPDPVALMHPRDLAALGVPPGGLVTLRSRRGQVSLFARADEQASPGAVFVAFCYYEAAINRLTNPALDPVAHIPEFKYCAIRAEAGGALPVKTGFRSAKAVR